MCWECLSHCLLLMLWCLSSVGTCGDNERTRSEQASSGMAAAGLANAGLYDHGLGQSRGQKAEEGEKTAGPACTSVQHAVLVLHVSGCTTMVIRSLPLFGLSGLLAGLGVG